MFRVNLPLHGMVPQTLGPGTTSHHQAIQGCLPSIFAFIPALSRIPCKYHAIQHCLQRLRLHQPALTAIHTHHRSTGGGRGANHDHAQGREGGGATLEHIYADMYVYMCVYDIRRPVDKGPGNRSVTCRAWLIVSLGDARAKASHIQKHI